MTQGPSLALGAQHPLGGISRHSSSGRDIKLGTALGWDKPFRPSVLRITQTRYSPVADYWVSTQSVHWTHPSLGTVI